MADYPFLLGVAFKPQAVAGTPENMALIGGGSGTGGAIDNVTDGAVLGDPNSGVGESGVSLGFGKNISEKAPISGSFTRPFADYIGRTVETLQVALPLKGNGATLSGTPADGEFQPDLGIDALLEAAGLIGGAWSGGVGYAYLPGAARLATGAAYIGRTAADTGQRVILADCQANSLTFDFTPGEIATVTFDLGANLNSVDELGTWPASPFEYNKQASLSAPSIESVGFTWGPSTPVARSLGFSTLQVTIDNESETIAASNQPGGQATRQTGRTVTINATFDAESSEIGFELAQLAESDIANAEQLTFTVGTAGQALGTANAYQINVPTPENVSTEVAEPAGASQAWTVSLTARSQTADTEFEFIYL